MNTLISIKVVKGNESTVDILNAIEEAFGEFDRIVKKYTRFNENSELSNLNRNSGEWVSVSDEFFMLIKQMIDLAKETNGAFDPTIIDFLEVYGYDKNYDFSKLDNPKLDSLVNKIAKERLHFSEIELDEKNNKVKLGKNQRIDLGGIGKGYAIECAAEKLTQVSKNFLIDAGGDVYASGLNQNDKKWTVGLKFYNVETESEEMLGGVELSNQALACSGSWARKVKQFHHIINPKTGEPMKVDYSTIFVIGKNPTICDGWATALFVGGRELSSKAPTGLKIMFK